MKDYDIWYEKYRPQTINDVIIPESLKNSILEFIKDPFKMPHLGLFSKEPGTGKSTLAKVILKETGAETLWINASLEKGIDVLRGKIQRFSATAPLQENKPKVVILDEFDHFTRDGQAAFRGFIDQFGSQVRFIFTGNYKENIIEPLLDRLEVYDFDEFDKTQIIKPLFSRLIYILNNEGIEFEKEQIVEVIREYYPSIRKMIGTLQKSSKDGVLKLVNADKSFYEEIVKFIKNKNVEELRKTVYGLENPNNLLTYLTQNIDKFKDILNGFLILGKYQYQAYFARDKHLNVLCACLEILKNE